MTQTDTRAGIDWRGGTVRQESELPLSTVRWFTTLLAVGLLVLVGYLIYKIWSHRSDRILLVTVSAGGLDVDRLAVPPIEYQDETLSRLTDFARSSDIYIHEKGDKEIDEESGEPANLADDDSLRYGLEYAERVDGLGGWLQGRLDDWAKRTFWGKGHRVVLVYVSAHATVFDGTASLVCGDYALDGTSGHCKLSDLLDQVESCDADLKVVVIDSGRLPPDPRTGLMVNNFPRLVRQEVEQREDESLWVFCSNGEGYVASVDHAHKSSLFGRSVLRALQGEADNMGYEGDPDGQVSLLEFSRFIEENCAGQLPFRVRAKSAEGEPAEPDKCLALIPKPEKKDAKDSKKGKPNPLLAKLGKKAAASARAKVNPAKSAVKGVTKTAKKTQKAANKTALTKGDAKGKTSGEVAKTSPKKNGGDAAETSKGAAAGDAASKSSSTPSDGGSQPAADAAPPEATEWLTRIKIAWQIHDQLDAPGPGRCSPSLFAPHFWRRIEALLIDTEHRLRSGSAYPQEQLMTELNDLIAQLNELRGAVREMRQANREATFDVGESLLTAWNELLNLKRDARYARYFSSEDDEGAAAVRAYQRLLYRAYYYVRWHDRASRYVEGQVDQRLRIRSLIESLGSLGETVRGQPGSISLDELPEAVNTANNLSREIDMGLIARAENICRTMTSQDSQRQCDELLAVPLLPADSRMKLLRALRGLSAKATDKDPVPPEAGDMTVSPTERSRRIKRVFDYEVKFAGLFQSGGLRVGSGLAGSIDGERPLSANLDAIKLASTAVGRFYADVPKKIDKAVEAGRFPDATKTLLRIVDARDVETLDWKKEIGALEVPASISAGQPDHVSVALSPVNLQYQEDRELKIDFTLDRAAEKPLFVKIEYPNDLVQIRPKNAVSPVGADGRFPVVMDTDKRKNGTLNLVVRALENASDTTRSAQLKLRVWYGNDTRQLKGSPRSFDFKLPAFDDVEFGYRTGGAAKDVFESAVNDVILLEPYPEIETNYRFALRNTSEKPRTVTVELFSVKRPAGANWTTGLVPYEPARLNALALKIFDGGNGPVLPDVTRLGKPQKVVLTADASKWQPVEFGKEEEDPEAAAKKEPAAKTAPKEAAATSPDDPGASITDGIVCRVTDEAAGPSWTKLKWIGLKPRPPWDYLEVTGNYNSKQQRVEVAVKWINPVAVAAMPNMALPAGPIALHLRRLAGFDLGKELVADNRKEIAPGQGSVTLNIKLPEDTWRDRDMVYRHVALDVGAWPRAFVLRFECWREGRDTVASQLTTRRHIQISRIAAMDDAWVYLVGPAADGEAPPEPAGEAKRLPIRLAADRVARFPAEYATQPLKLDFRLDAPRNAFADPGSGDVVTVVGRGRELAPRFFSDRQMSARLIAVSEGWLVVRADVADYSVQLVPIGTQGEEYPIGVEMAIGGSGSGAVRSAASLPESDDSSLAVFMDGSGPQLVGDPIFTFAPAATQDELGTTINVKMEFEDPSGVQKFVYAFNLEGTLEGAMPVPPRKVPGKPNSYSVEFSIPTDAEKMKKGEYRLRCVATDSVENDRPTQIYRFPLGTPKPAMPKPKEKLKIDGIVKRKMTFKDVPEGGADVRLIRDGAEVGSTKSDADGRFSFEDLEEGKYDLAVQLKSRMGSKFEGARKVEAKADWPEPAVVFVTAVKAKASK